MQMIDTTNIPVMIKESNLDEIKWSDGTIIELGYDEIGNPYYIIIEWNNKKTRLVPKFLNGKMISRKGRHKTIEVFLEPRVVDEE
jgi:hypothetical protein